MARSGKRDIGAWFEGKVQAALDRLRTEFGLFYFRLPDSKAAGQFLPAAPADFLVAYNGKALLLECKASEKYNSLKECLAAMVDDGQAGSHRLWMGARCGAFFLFYSDRLGMVEVWDSSVVIKARQKGTPLASFPLYEFALDKANVEFLGLFR